MTPNPPGAPSPPAPSPRGRCGGSKLDNLHPVGADSPSRLICPQAPWLGLLLRPRSPPSEAPSARNETPWPPAPTPRGLRGGAILSNLRPGRADSPRRFICPRAPRRGPPLRLVATPPFAPESLREPPLQPAPPSLGHCGGSCLGNPRPGRAGSPSRCICPQASRRVPPPPLCAATLRSPASPPSAPSISRTLPTRLLLVPAASPSNASDPSLPLGLRCISPT